MAKITIKSLNQQGVLQKLVIGIMLMVIIPFLLMGYLLLTEASALLLKDSVQVTIFFIVAAATCGYILTRKVAMSVVRLAKDVQAVTQGDLKKRIQTQEEDEVNELAQYFNKITSELEKNINQLKESKKVLQNVLLRIGNAMSSDQKIGSILELTLETLVNAVGASSGVVMLLKDDVLTIFVSCGLNIENQHSVEIKRGAGIIGWVAKEGKPQNITRIQQDRRFDVEVKMGFAHKSTVCVPLMYKDKILGTISLNDKNSEEEFSEDDVMLLENMALQTAVAIENSRLNEDIERTYVETISALAMAVEAKDPYSRGHTKRVKEYVTILAKEFNLDDETVRTLQDAAMLHDIGKIGIRDDVLLKPAVLNSEERKQMQRHAIIGENILKPIRSLKKVAYLARHHQEQVNGKGYPDGLTGEEMNLPLKILIVADAFDAMSSDRPYRKGMTKQQAKKELKKYSGIYFDPQVVETFDRVI
ncbi:MAG: GAF domain-containing protein [Candidatus Omnitrophica bacterium]|nr:GAF domain-containing protein [Candidatus Omnitrophota bacterium]